MKLALFAFTAELGSENAMPSRVGSDALIRIKKHFIHQCFCNINANVNIIMSIIIKIVLTSWIPERVSPSVSRPPLCKLGPKATCLAGGSRSAGCKQGGRLWALGGDQDPRARQRQPSYCAGLTLDHTARRQLWLRLRSVSQGT